MFEINLKDVEVEKNVNFDELVKITDGYSGADIANVCREAALMNMRRKIMNVNKDGNFDVMKMIEDVKFQNDIDAPITMKDLVAAVKNISKSVSKNDLKKYEEWTKEFASK
jgi:katanin p60 ATPase-containing subunit A1